VKKTKTTVREDEWTRRIRECSEAQPPLMEPNMKAPVYREYVHHVRTERGVSTYQIKTGGSKHAEVLATVVVESHRPYCVTCSSRDCKHANKILDRITGVNRV